MSQGRPGGLCVPELRFDVTSRAVHSACFNRFDRYFPGGRKLFNPPVYAASHETCILHAFLVYLEAEAANSQTARPRAYTGERGTLQLHQISTRTRLINELIGNSW